jgi:hypothetical protein
LLARELTKQLSLSPVIRCVDVMYPAWASAAQHHQMYLELARHLMTEGTCRFVVRFPLYRLELVNLVQPLFL